MDLYKEMKLTPEQEAKITASEPIFHEPVRKFLELYKCWIGLPPAMIQHLIGLFRTVEQYKLSNPTSRPDYYIIPPSAKRLARLDITQWGWRKLLLLRNFDVNVVYVTQAHIDAGYFIGSNPAEETVMWDTSKAHLIPVTEEENIKNVLYIVVTVINNNTQPKEKKAKAYTPDALEKAHKPKGSNALWDAIPQLGDIHSAIHIQKLMYAKSACRDFISMHYRHLVPGLIEKEFYNAGEEVTDIIKEKINATISSEELESVKREITTARKLDPVIHQAVNNKQDFIFKHSETLKKLDSKLTDYNTVEDLFDYITKHKGYFYQAENLPLRDIVEAKLKTLFHHFVTNTNDLTILENFFNKYKEYLVEDRNYDLRTLLFQEYEYKKNKKGI